MTRAKLVEKVSKSNPCLSIQQVEQCVDLIFNEITSALSSGYRVELRGFGIFSTRKRKARIGRNPRTGEIVKVDEKEIPFFKTSKKLNERLNNKF